MLVFGGLFSSNQRFNDTYILKIGKSYIWRQPPNQKSGLEPKNTESKIGAPDPRANHTATYLKSKNAVYVIAGHGGVGYSRKSFNDVYSLDVSNDNFEWTKIDATGNLPENRGGHTACLLPNSKIFINGGWNSISQFSNSWIFDAEKKEWTELDTNMEIPRWNHCTTIVPALPKSKIFIFGGSTGYFEEGAPRNFGNMTESILFMEVTDELKNGAYFKCNPENSVLPTPRENCTLVYDQDDQRLILFGGWSNNYLNDIYQINISSITGPEYAIYSLQPALGPLTGKTNCEIIGEGFKNLQTYYVRFSFGKIHQEVQAIYLNETTLNAQTPNFEMAGPRDAEVRIRAERYYFFAYFVKYPEHESVVCIIYLPP